MFLVHPDQTGQVNAMVERYRSIVQSGGGAMHRLENLGLRPLAYPINKVKKAHYVLMNIETTSETIGEIKNSFQFNDAVVRNMVTRCDSAVTEPSPLMRSAKQEEERAAEAQARAAAETRARAAAEARAPAAAETRAPAAAETPAPAAETPAPAAADADTGESAGASADANAGASADTDAQADKEPSPSTN